MTDPRKSSAYVLARRRWISQWHVGAPCSLCGLGIDVTLSGNHPAGPTIEHTLPVRDYPEAALEQAYWRLAHRRCNSRQGAQVTNAKRRGEPPTEPSRLTRPERDW